MLVFVKNVSFFQQFFVACFTYYIIFYRKPAIPATLPPGHKIGKPAPLFAKIENEQVEALKKKYAGKQQPAVSSRGDAPTDVAGLEAAVAKQGDKVRQLKSSGVEKAVWQPEVAILLDLKKKLEAAQKNAKSAPSAVSGTISLEAIKKLESDIAAQALVVRKLKEGGAEKSKWQPEVTILLDLKKKLEAAQKNASNAPAAAPTPGKTSPEAIKKLEDDVAAQALVVRKLKEGGAEKSKWQPEVDKLLKLKGELAVATGAPLAAPGKGKGKK